MLLLKADFKEYGLFSENIASLQSSASCCYDSKLADFTLITTLKLITVYFWPLLNEFFSNFSFLVKVLRTRPIDEPFEEKE